MTFLDLFSGIGGFRLAMEQAGHICVGHCEIDKFANKSYIAMHKPKESEWYADDITRVRAEDMPRADCWCFGFPCQDISIAGKQQGFRGRRSSLFFTVTGLIREQEEEDRPAYLLIENVKNLLSVNRGGDFARLLLELDAVGYDAEWAVLNTSDVLPQNRARVFIVGHLRGRSTRKIFPIGADSEKTDELQRQCVNSITTRTGEGTSVGCYILVKSKQHEKGLMGGYTLRKLTPSECFRLQGFPDDRFGRARKVCSDSQLYKQVGNSVTIPVVYEIAKRIKIGG